MPLLLLVILSIAILMYYLFMVSSLIIRSRGTEIAVLKSRGATTLQVTLLMLVEGLILAVPAIALGPFLALGIVTTLGEALAAESPEIGLAPVALSPRAFLLGASGGVLSVAMLSISALVTARHGVVQFRQMGARPPSVPFLHRYYVDFMLLGIIGFIYWQLQENESFLVRELGESKLSIDYSLLIGPILLLVALGLIVLRLFPLALRVVSRAAEGMNVVWPVQALRRIARDPIIPGALVVLVMLATALGVVASTFSASLQGSQEDRALYNAGAEVRVKFQVSRATPPVYGNGREIDFGEEVESASLIYRHRASLTTVGLGRDVTLMAVDAETFADAAWYRDDLSSQSLEGMMGKIRAKSLPDKGTRVAGRRHGGGGVGTSRQAGQSGRSDHAASGRCRPVLQHLGWPGWMRPEDDYGYHPYTLDFQGLAVHLRLPGHGCRGRGATYRSDTALHASRPVHRPLLRQRGGSLLHGRRLGLHAGGVDRAGRIRRGAGLAAHRGPDSAGTHLDGPFPLGVSLGRGQRPGGLVFRRSGHPGGHCRAAAFRPCLPSQTRTFWI